MITLLIVVIRVVVVVVLHLPYSLPIYISSIKFTKKIRNSQVKNGFFSEERKKHETLYIKEGKATVAMTTGKKRGLNNKLTIIN